MSGRFGLVELHETSGSYKVTLARFVWVTYVKRSVVCVQNCNASVDKGEVCAGAGSPPGVMSADRGAGVSEEGLRLREAHQQVSHLELSLVQVRFSILAVPAVPLVAMLCLT